MSTKAILLLAFFEGVSVMFIELLGGKMLIPYFGNSLIIWTSTIGVTMSSLMIGYFIGGYLSKLKNSLTVLFFLLTITAIWMALMPSLVRPIINKFSDAELYSASIFSAVGLFALPLMLFGACPPILIAKLSVNNKAGISSGRVFAVSTIGSIVCALVVGFLIISKYGISGPLVVYGVLFFLLTVALLWNVFKEKLYFLIAALPIALIVLATNRSSIQLNSLFVSESLQGQLRVFDEGERIGQPRYLQINGVNQTKTFIDFNNPIMNNSGWWYVHLDGAFASHKPSGSDALLMGFGGGSLALELTNLNFNIDVAEIDARLPAIAHDFFLFDTSRVDFYIDDARHFIKKQKGKKKYDIVVIDLLHGEVQPNHIFTVEGLNELRQLLKDDATVLVNYQSNFDEPKQPYLAILNTFWAAGYDAKMTNARSDRPADYIFVASPNVLEEALFNDNHMNDCCFNNVNVLGFRKNPIYVDKDNINQYLTSELLVLTDNHPILETMNKESIITWRKHMINQTERIKFGLFK
jgi:MFS family permease